MAKNAVKDRINCPTETDSFVEHRLCDSPSSEVTEKIKNRLVEIWVDDRSKPRSAEELFEIGKRTIDPLFHEPPLGPIPEYLQAHLHAIQIQMIYFAPQDVSIQVPQISTFLQQ